MTTEWRKRLKNGNEVVIHSRDRETIFLHLIHGKTKRVQIIEVSKQDIFRGALGKVRKLESYLDGSAWRDRIMSSVALILEGLLNEYESAGAMYEDVTRRLATDMEPDMADGKTLASKENQTIGFANVEKRGKPNYGDPSGVANPTGYTIEELKEISAQIADMLAADALPPWVEEALKEEEGMHLHNPMTPAERKKWSRFVQKLKKR